MVRQAPPTSTLHKASSGVILCQYGYKTMKIRLEGSITLTTPKQKACLPNTRIDIKGLGNTP